MTVLVRPVRFTDEEIGRARQVRHEGPTLPHGEPVEVRDDARSPWVQARVVRDPHAFSSSELLVERV